MNGMATQAQDSELQHSFGPQEIGFDYLPLELTPPDGTAVRTQTPAWVLVRAWIMGPWAT